MLVLTDEVWVAMGVCIPEGSGDIVVAPSSEGTVAAVGGGEEVTSSTMAPGCDSPASTHVGEAGRAVPAVGDGEVTASSVAAPNCDPLASTHVGVARRAALHRAMRTRCACRRGRLPCRDGGVGVSELAPNGRMSVPWPSPVAMKSRLPNQITYPVGNGLDLLAIPGDQMGTKEKCHAAALPGAPTVGALTRRSGPNQ